MPQETPTPWPLEERRKHTRPMPSSLIAQHLGDDAATVNMYRSWEEAARIEAVLADERRDIIYMRVKRAVIAISFIVIAVSLYIIFYQYGLEGATR